MALLRPTATASGRRGAPAELQLQDATGTPQHWQFVPLAVHPDYLATLAAVGTDWTPHCFDWQ